MREGKMKSATSYVTVGLLLTCVLAHTIHGLRLRKTGRREGRVGARMTGVQEGKIVFGRVFEKGTIRESPSNSSVNDESAYQADSPVMNTPSPNDAAWKRMATSLQCSADQMRLRVVGAGASTFAVDQGLGLAPMSLSQVPSTCGYTMHRNPLSLVMLVPYNGCNMVQQGGSHMLPLLWQGTPVSLVCPKPAEPSPEPQQPITKPQEPKVTETPIPPKQEPPMSQWLYPYNLGPQSYATAAPTAKPVTQKIPHYPLFYPQNLYFPNMITTTTPPPTTQPATQPPTQPATKPPAEPHTSPKIPPQYLPPFPMQFPPQYLPPFPMQFPHQYPPLFPHQYPPQFPMPVPFQYPPQFLSQFPKLPPQLPPQQLPTLPPQLPPQQLPKLPPQLPPQQLPKLPPQFPMHLPQLPPQFPMHLLQYPPQFPQKNFLPYPTTVMTTTTVTPTTKKSEPVTSPVPPKQPPVQAAYPYLYSPYFLPHGQS